jgi:hypothetical protein
MLSRILQTTFRNQKGLWPFLRRVIPVMLIGQFLLPLESCKKFVTVDSPVTSTNASNVYATDATAAAVMTNIYAEMSQSQITDGGGPTSLSLFAGLSADELTLYSNSAGLTYNAYYTDALTTTPALTTDYWKIFYPIIYIPNAAIEGLANSTTLTPAVQQQVMGEAKFMRAFCYFYLVNLYGDVPLVLGSNYAVNDTLSRTDKSKVWQQIIMDLEDAQGLLSENYLNADALTTTDSRVRPTKWAATALLARAYLYTDDWTDAKNQADLIINNSTLYGLDTLNGVFLTNSSEAIWQLQPVTTGFDTQDALGFIIPPSGPDPYSYPVYLSQTLLNSFEPGDQRRADWVDSTIIDTTVYYYVFKYKNNTQNAPVTESTTLLRLAEQFLIRAEAEANGAGNGISAAVTDLNVIRIRAGLNPYSGPMDQASVLSAIYHERQVELFTEWGHRWLDLKRTSSVDPVMGVGGECAAKGGTWNTDWAFYPIPLTDLQADPKLVQNNGYQY